MSNILAQDESLKKDMKHFVMGSMSHPMVDQGEETFPERHSIARIFSIRDGSREVEMGNKRYNDLINNTKTQENFVDITKYEKNPNSWSTNYVYIKDKRIIASFDLSSNGAYRFYSNTYYQLPNQKIYVNLSKGLLTKYIHQLPQLIPY